MKLRIVSMLIRDAVPVTRNTASESLISDRCCGVRPITLSLANIEILAECPSPITAISEMMMLCRKLAWWRVPSVSHRDLQVLQELLGLAGTETI
jgi:hypothetical protein